MGLGSSIRPDSAGRAAMGRVRPPGRPGGLRRCARVCLPPPCRPF